MIYVTSDWHFCHNQPFLYAPRGFMNVDDMSAAIVSRHNEVVSPQDDVYVLGDLMLNDNIKGLEYIKSLNGKLHVAIGNHDTDARIELYKTCENIVEVQYAYRLKYKGLRFYLTHYPTLCGNWDDEDELYTQILNLCGHTHTKNPFYHWDDGSIFHCEVDTINCYPWTIDEIIEEMKEKLKGE